MSKERKFFIAGVQHHQMNKVINDLEEKQELDLVPEPDNKFDPNAIRIELRGILENTMLGYVPKKFSSEISALIETHGESVFCVITSLDKKAKPWEQCKVSIEVEEELDNDSAYV